MWADVGGCCYQNCHQHWATYIYHFLLCKLMFLDVQLVQLPIFPQNKQLIKTYWFTGFVHIGLERLYMDELSFLKTSRLEPSSRVMDPTTIRVIEKCKNYHTIFGCSGDPNIEHTRPGKLTVCYGKSPFLLGKSTLNI